MSAPLPQPARKAVLISMLAEGSPLRAALQRRARRPGFDAIEMQTIARDDEAAEIRDAASEDRPAHSFRDERGSLAVPAVERRPRRRRIEASPAWKRRCAMRRCGAPTRCCSCPPSSIATTSYRDAWTRSQQVIRERLLPLARELKVIVAVEEVWNKFLLSPLEFARYVDELDSPWLKAYFDVGNVVFYGYPQDWIRTLGAPHREGALEGLPPRSAERPLRLDATSATATSTGSRCAGPLTTSATRILHDGSRGRRRGVLEGSRGPRRPVPRGAEASLGDAD